MTLAVNPIEVSQAVVEWNSPWQSFYEPNLFIGVAGGDCSSPNWNATNDKNNNNKVLCFFQFQFL